MEDATMAPIDAWAKKIPVDRRCYSTINRNAIAWPGYFYQPNIYANMSGATIVASLSTIYLGV